MKELPFSFFVIIIIAVTITVLSFSTIQNANNPNVDALARTEGYPLADCLMASTVGDDYTIMYFCDDNTDDYTIYDCKVSFRTPSLTKGKCVTH